MVVGASFFDHKIYFIVYDFGLPLQSVQRWYGEPELRTACGIRADDP